MRGGSPAENSRSGCPCALPEPTRASIGSFSTLEREGGRTAAAGESVVRASQTMTASSKTSKKIKTPVLLLFRD